MFKKIPAKPKEKKRRKLLPMWAAVIILLFVMAGNLVVLLLLNSMVSGLRSYSDMIDVVDTLRSNITDTDQRNQKIYEYYYQDTQSRLEMAGNLYNRGLFESDPDLAFRILGKEDSYFVTDSKGNILDGYAEVDQDFLKDLISMVPISEWGINGITYDEDTLLFASRLRDGTYIMTRKSREMDDKLDENLYNTETLLRNSETWKSFAFETYYGRIMTAPGIVEEYFGEPVSDVITEITPYMELREADLWIAFATYNGRLFAVVKGDLSRLQKGRDLYFLTDFGETMKESFFIVLLIHLIIWLGAIIVMYFIVQFRKVHQDDEDSLKELRYRSAILILAAVSVTGGLTYYLRTMFSFSAYILDDDEELYEITTQYENSGEAVEELESVFSKLYSRKAEIVGSYLNAFPEERTEETLKYLSDLFGMEYVILFDQSGNEILSSSDYVNMKLSSKKDDTSYQFRRLLNGSHVLVTKTGVDDLTGLSHQLAGVSLRNTENEPDGLLLCAYKSEIAEEAVKSASLESILEAASSSGQNLYYMIDPETKRFTYSPQGGLTGLSAADYGFTDEILKEGYKGSVSILGDKYSSSEINVDGKYLYQMIPYSTVFRVRPAFTATVCVLALFIYLIGAGLMKRVKIRVSGEKEEEKGFLHPEISIGQNLVAEEKTTAMIVRLTRIFGLFLAVVLLFRSQWLSDSSMIRYVMDGKWREGLNIFALTAVIIMILLTSIGVRIVRGVLSLFSSVASSTTETYLRLARSAVDYFSVLIVGYMTFKMFGMDMKTLVTTTSIMMMLVGLGAQDLTEDIIAGLFLMFESEFQVGDVIDVNGKIGIVKEIGLHSTKLIDENNNILLLNNSSVKNLINRTQNTSFSFCTFTVPASVPISDLEKIFAEELPKLQEKYPEFIEAPFFKGVDAFRGDSMQCTVAAEMKEADRVRMGRTLNKEIKRILSEHEISIG